MTEMVNCSHHDKSGIRQACALGAKLTALNETARACGIGLRMKIVCEGRMEAGHRVYGAETEIDAQSEALEELADVVNYAAIARMHGAWTWRWRVAGWLVGVAWRVMR